MVEPLGYTEYIRTAEAARILDVSTKTVSRWVRAGKIRHVVTLGGHRRFPVDAVRALALEMSAVQTETKPGLL